MGIKIDSYYYQFIYMCMTKSILRNMGLPQFSMCVCVRGGGGGEGGGLRGTTTYVRGG